MKNLVNLVRNVDFRTIRIVNADTLLVIKNGKAIDEMTPEAMLALAQAMIQQANRAIETRPKEAEKLALDNAILLRAGAGNVLGLTDNPKIKEMAAKEAVSNRDLRRYMPGGVKSQEQVGTPGIVKHAPKKEPSE